MASRLRIARLDPSAYTPVLAEGAPASALHRRLDALIRRHLPGVTASLLAAPAPTADGRFIEWYSDLSGQPVALSRLPATEQDKVRALLEDRTRSLAELAGRLTTAEDADTRDLAEILRQALAYPGEDTVYVVGGQPVLTFWGFRPLTGGAGVAAPPPVAAAAAAAPGAAGSAAPAAAAETVAGASSGFRLPRWVWPVLGLMLLGLAGWGLVHFGVVRWPPWGPDYEALLKTATDEEASLERHRAELRAQLEAALEVCAIDGALAAARAEEPTLRAAIDSAEEQLRAALALCPLRADLARAREEGQALSARTTALSGDLAKALEQCRRQAEAERKKAEDDRRRAEAAQRKAEDDRKKAEAALRKAEDERKRVEDAAKRQAQAQPPPAAPPKEPSQPPPAAKTEPGRQPCPGERPPEDAPDVAVVLDASGSMGLPASATASDIQRQLRQMGGIFGLGASILLGQTSGPSRLEEAKKGINSVVRSLPNDVDVGLTVLQRCPAADNMGFFSGAQRGQLYQRVNALRPMQGTPLAQGIVDAAGMVDGVKAPAVIVVISDGEDSCGGDPCAAARRVKAQKPQLTINVVDILGNGASNCVAAATGGHVLKPEDGLAFEKTIRKAAQEALKPDYCP